MKKAVEWNRWITGLMSSLILLSIAPPVLAQGLGRPRLHAGRDTNSVEYAVAQIDLALSAGDVSIAGEAASEKGRGVLGYLLGQQAYAPFPVEIVNRRTSVDGEKARYEITATCSCENGDGTGYFVYEYVLQQSEGGWRFDDVMVKSLCAHDLDLSADYLRTHPFIAGIPLLQRNPGATLGAMVAGIVRAVAEKQSSKESGD